MNFARQLDPQVLEELHARGRPVPFTRGQRLMQAQLKDDRVLLLDDGYVKISRTTSDGREAVLDFRGPGELLGERAALREDLPTPVVEALTDGEALSVAASSFVQWLMARPEASLAVMRVLAMRLHEADTQRMEYGASQTLARVAGRLATLADRFGQTRNGAVEIALAISQEELAAWSGSSREATVKALRTLRSLNVVETSRRRLVVLDPQALELHVG
jgi:CRP-like cAMP-binding protein